MRWLFTLQLCLTAAVATAQQTDGENAMVKEWRQFILESRLGVNYFVLTAGDSISLDCGKLDHVAATGLARLNFTWKLFGRPLIDEGDTGHVQISDGGSRLVVDDVGELDSGAYCCYGDYGQFKQLLLEAFADSREDARRRTVPVGLFVVRVNRQRSFVATADRPLRLNATPWLAPFAEALRLLRSPADDWFAEWRHNGEPVIHCRRLSRCELSSDVVADGSGAWQLAVSNRMPLASLLYRRVVLEFSLSVLPAADYIDSFHADTQQYYVVYTVFAAALFVLSLHLFTNLTWTPFAFDVLPDEASEKAVMEQSGFLLKQCTVKLPGGEAITD